MKIKRKNKSIRHLKICMIEFFLRVEMFKFSLFNFLLATALIVCLAAWYADHKRLVQKNQQATVENSLTSKDPKKRVAAIEQIETWATIDNAPAVIFAITDPDIRVRLKARSIMERISGQSFRSGDGESYESFLDENYKWGKWLNSINPDAPFRIPYSRLDIGAHVELYGYWTNETNKNKVSNTVSENDTVKTESKSPE